MNYEDTESYRQMESILDEELKRQGLNVEPVDEPSADDENARAEKTLTQMFDVLVMLKKVISVPSHESMTLVEASLGFLDHDTLKAMVCTLVGIVSIEQLDEHHQIAINACRSGEIVQLAKEYGEQTR
jgi:hypothetical protein